jgi:SAM-dependent methyltransferase
MKAHHRTECRICKGSNLDEFLCLDSMPLANGFLQKDQLGQPEHFFPLTISLCKNCSLVQLVDIVPKDVLFKSYPYFSSVSKTFVHHCEELAEEVAQRFLGKSRPLVIDIGSNDGALLKPMIKYAKVLGIEPATNIAEFANSQGIETINDFFNKKLALEISQNRGKASVVFALNVMNHVDNLIDFADGIDVLLDDKGIFVFEVPYVLDLLESGSFDTMYHEMHSYFSVVSLLKLFSQYDLNIFDVKRVSLHAGSIRVYVQKAGRCLQPSNAVHEILALEKDKELNRLETYLRLSKRAKRVKTQLVKLLRALKADHKRIVGYGAAAKGNVLLNYCKIGTDLIDYIADDTPAKQGLYTPGMHIPVYSVEKLREDNPDYILILPWNFAEEIMSKEEAFKRCGGKFIIPIPEPRVVS